MKLGDLHTDISICESKDPLSITNTIIDATEDALIIFDKLIKQNSEILAKISPEMIKNATPIAKQIIDQIIADTNEAMESTLSGDTTHLDGMLSDKFSDRFLKSLDIPDDAIREQLSRWLKDIISKIEPMLDWASKELHKLCNVSYNVIKNLATGWIDELLETFKQPEFKVILGGSTPLAIFGAWGGVIAAGALGKLLIPLSIAGGATGLLVPIIVIMIPSLFRATLVTSLNTLNHVKLAIKNTRE